MAQTAAMSCRCLPTRMVSSGTWTRFLSRRFDHQKSRFSNVSFADADFDSSDSDVPKRAFDRLRHADQNRADLPSALPLPHSAHLVSHLDGPYFIRPNLHSHYSRHFPLDIPNHNWNSLLLAQLSPHGSVEIVRQGLKSRVPLENDNLRSALCWFC